MASHNTPASGSRLAEIHFLRESGEAGALGRRAAALATAIEGGDDLGARGPHIRALGRSMAGLLAEFRRKDEALREILVQLEAHGIAADAASGFRASSVRAQRLIAQLARLAAAYPEEGNLPGRADPAALYSSEADSVDGATGHVRAALPA